MREAVTEPDEPIVQFGTRGEDMDDMMQRILDLEAKNKDLEAKNKDLEAKNKDLEVKNTVLEQTVKQVDLHLTLVTNQLLSDRSAAVKKES